MHEKRKQVEFTMHRTNILDRKTLVENMQRSLHVLCGVSYIPEVDHMDFFIIDNFIMIIPLSNEREYRYP